MRFLKPFIFVAAAGFLAGCELPANGSDGFPAIGSGSEIAIADAGLAGLLDQVSMRDGILAYSYYTDVVADGRVLTGADVHCGGAGQAVITLQGGDRGGRAYNTMLITCR